MRIIGPPSGTLAQVTATLTSSGSTAHPRFTGEMLHPLWETALAYEIDPVGVVAQAYKETAGGNFTGKVTAQHFNTCGLKVRYPGYGGAVTAGDEQLAHAAFASWDVGAEAHVQHLRAYAGWPVVGDLIVDPRYVYVTGNALENWSELGGRWAPSPTYGTEVEALMLHLTGRA